MKKAHVLRIYKNCVAPTAYYHNHDHNAPANHRLRNLNDGNESSCWPPAAPMRWHLSGVVSGEYMWVWFCIAHSISHTVLSSNRMPEPDPMLFVNYVNKAMSTPQTDVTYRKYIILFILFVVLPVWLSSKYLEWTGIVKS